jgi:iron(III) transport system substrate-binding protein
LLVASLLVTALGACGDDDDDGAAETTTAAAETTAASDTATTSASTGAADTSPSTEGPAATAGGEEWDAIVAAAEEEGDVVLFAGRTEEQMAPLVEAFEEAYPGIDAEALRVRVSDLTVRVDQELEQDALSTDVVFTTATDWLSEHAAAGDLAVPTGPGTERWPAEYFRDGIAVLTTDAVIIEYNTDMIEAPPTAWDSLIDEPFGLKDNTAPLIAALYEYLEETNPGLLQKYADQDPQVYDQTEPAILSGEIAWAPWGQISSVEIQKAQGAPVDWAIPESGTIALPQAGAAFVEAPHPNAALVLLDFMMSEAGQVAINGDMLGRSLVDTDIPGQVELDTDLLTIVDLTEYDDAHLTEFAARFDELFR